jgi:hypothetical protein
MVYSIVVCYHILYECEDRKKVGELRAKIGVIR